MLFGSEKIQEQIVSDAKKFASEKGYELVYGAMVGGISRGLQYADSDYDTRFLYIEKDFPLKIRYPWEYKETELKHRVYFDESSAPYEWIPLWELTSFFQFLKYPAFDNEMSCGLHNVVGWTMQSPYVWDPYGLQMKLLPLVNMGYNEKWHIQYQYEQIQQYWNHEDKIIIKDYLYAVYAALAINWACRYHSFHPVSIKTLISTIAPLEMRERIFTMEKLSKEISNDFIKTGGEGRLHESHFEGLIDHDAVLDQYIKDMIIYSKQVIEKEEHTANCDEIIKEIYRQVYEAVNLEQKVLRVSE